MKAARCMTGLYDSYSVCDELAFNFGEITSRIFRNTGRTDRFVGRRIQKPGRRGLDRRHISLRIPHPSLPLSSKLPRSNKCLNMPGTDRDEQSGGRVDQPVRILTKPKYCVEQNGEGKARDDRQNIKYRICLEILLRRLLVFRGL